MNSIEVTKRVWDRLLAIRYEDACACCGDWTKLERSALDFYGPLARRDLQPFTVGQIGQSVDGRIASANGDVGKVSGPDGLAHLHRMRALVDGVVIGVKTAIHDAPRLTVRLCEGQSPARIVIDPSGRLPNESPVLRDDGVRRIVIQATDTVRAGGVEVIQLPAQGGQINPSQIIETLRGEGILSLLIEGGSFTLAKFMEQELLDRLHIAVAPIVIGSGPLGLTTNNPSTEIFDAIRAKTCTYFLGEEVLYDLELTQEASSATKPRH